MYIMQLVFDPTVATVNSQNGRFEDKGSGNTGSKVWWQVAFNSAPNPDPTSPLFNPRSTTDQSITLLGTHDGNLLVSPTAAKVTSPFFGTMVGVFFVAQNLPAQAQGVLAFTPFVLIGRSPGLQRWTSPFRVGFVQTGIVQSVFGPPNPLPSTYSLSYESGYTPGNTGFYFPLSQVINVPPNNSEAQHYPFLVGLIATNSSGAVVAQWCHDPEMDVSM